MICIYDNPITRTRQMWQDGKLVEESSTDLDDFKPFKIHHGSIDALGLVPGTYRTSIAWFNRQHTKGLIWRKIRQHELKIERSSCESIRESSRQAIEVLLAAREVANNAFH